MRGRIRSRQSSVHFGIIQSNRFPVGMLAAMVMRFELGRVMVWILATSAVTSERLMAVTVALAQVPLPSKSSMSVPTLRRETLVRWWDSSAQSLFLPVVIGLQ